MPELVSRRYHTKTLPSTIYSHKDLKFAAPGQIILEAGSQIGGIYNFTPLEEAVCQVIGNLSCVLSPIDWPITGVQFQDTGSAEEQGPSKTAENDKAFTATDLIADEEQQFMEWIYLFRIMLSVPYKNKLAERFITLFNDVKEEDPQSIGPSIESLRVFFNFLRVHDNLRMPSISLTTDNLIYASWRDGNKIFSVIFSENGFAQFVIFEPDRRDPSRNVRLSGNIAVEKLLETVESTGVSNWILDDRRSDS